MPDEAARLSDAMVGWLLREYADSPGLTVFQLALEVERLRRENRLLHLSRGSAPASMGLD